MVGVGDEAGFVGLAAARRARSCCRLTAGCRIEVVLRWRGGLHTKRVRAGGALALPHFGVRVSVTPAGWRRLAVWGLALPRLGVRGAERGFVRFVAWALALPCIGGK
jgi:hypothetical protein